MCGRDRQREAAVAEGAPLPRGGRNPGPPQTGRRHSGDGPVRPPPIPVRKPRRVKGGGRAEEEEEPKLN